ncbi:MAG: armadillo-type fold-containing protein [Nostoc sp. DedVER02]|uniref:armadillo-type fold-containing protein n=1 Tax=unclassified Nostoc TaxID=2593658 RepID=UPI002AD3F226|nr:MULTISPECIES: armadillo-type fold-containing protein [unclassified Nostoc]MDZ7990338.1 armadillo-type fold-containing protein [Nostoc sp. DedVER02]MDZ8115970.1 armadillo-type fold-containing protein [Nostoc sp. DedVER01b]
MAQASSYWQQLINQIPNWNWSHPLFKTKGATKQQLKRFSGPGGFLGFLTIFVAMFLWNWMLLLALLMGIGVMVLVYSMQKWDWQLHWSKIRKFLNSSNRRLVLAVISGGLATVITYMAAAIWIDSRSSWIAAGAIVQGVGTLLTLILLVWQFVNFYENREEDHLDRLLVNLTDKDPLKRLIALRQLTKFISRQRVDPSVQQDVVECLQLLLSREEEVAIRDAAFKSLQACDQQDAIADHRLQALPLKTAVPFVPISPKVKHHVY